jgi:mono/diheme cytochrome c family protein
MNDVSGTRNEARSREKNCFAPRSSWFVLALVGCLLSLSGCSTPEYPPELTYPPRTDWLVAQPPTCPPPEPEQPGQLDKALARIHELGGKAFNPAEIPQAQRAELQQTLVASFGTPAQPKVEGDEEVHALVVRLGMEPERLSEGSRLYRRHCLQCHGLSGDGRGPTGQWIYPHPRDYRQGVFKWVSSAGTAARKPRRADLSATIRRGIDGTSMPSFGLLADADIEAVIDCVIHLSVRGEVEYRVSLALLSECDAGPDGDIVSDAEKRLKRALRDWAAAQEGGIEPAVPTPEDEEQRLSPTHLASVRRGYQSFIDARENGCITCHEDFGRQAKPRYDVWGTQVKPADLTAGVYHGGKQPLDLFRRIRGGVGPSGMPAVTALGDDQVWDLVHFVQALPYPRMLPPDVREKVYPKEIAQGRGAD